MVVALTGIPLAGWTIVFVSASKFPPACKPVSTWSFIVDKLNVGIVDRLNVGISTFTGNLHFHMKSLQKIILGDFLLRRQLLDRPGLPVSEFHREMSDESFDDNFEPELEASTLPDQVVNLDEERVALENNSDSETDAEAEELLSAFRPKAKAKKSKKGRKSSWPEDVVKDLVNIICSNEYMNRKIIYENTKNSRNGMLYENIIKQMITLCKERNEEYPFSVTQTRTKFKHCICICKAAFMTMKTSSGVKRFQEDKNLGAWFNQRFPLVKSRESAQPEKAIEPSATQSSSPGTENTECESGDNLSSVETLSLSSGRPAKRPKLNASNERPAKKNLFVPLKENNKKEKDDAIVEAVKSFNQVIDTDPSKELINFLREDNEKSRQHELELFKIQMQSQM
eukprot:gene14686-16211_t